MLYALARRTLGHPVIIGRLRKTSPAYNIVENLQRPYMNRSVRAGCSVIIFVNFSPPLLTLPIRRIACKVERVKNRAG